MRLTKEAYSAGPPVVPLAPEPRRIASMTSRDWPSWLFGKTAPRRVGELAFT